MTRESFCNAVADAETAQHESFERALSGANVTVRNVGVSVAGLCVFRIDGEPAESRKAAAALKSAGYKLAKWRMREGSAVRGWH